MELRDFIVTPILIIIVYGLAYFIRPMVTDAHTRKYFIPAFTAKIIGALAVGFIYQFYYDRGGDTYAYFYQSKVIHEALFDDPFAAVKLLFDSGADYNLSASSYDPSTYNYASRIRFYAGKSEFFIVRLTALLGFFCASTYSSIAVLFSVFSFSGLWALFVAFKERFEAIHLRMAIAVLFLPSVVFWGSGVMKDTVVIGAFGWAFYCIDRIFIRGINPKNFLLYLILLVSLYSIYMVKIYVLFSLVPAALLWILLVHKNKIRDALIRLIVAPVFVVLAGVGCYFILQNISEGDRRYDVEGIAERTKINAEYLYYVSVKNDGSAYYLGELDGSLKSMLILAPAAINVTLFRPYLWEVKNPLMLLSFLESTLFLLATLALLISPGPLKSLKIIYENPLLIFCFVFSIILAVGVGLNSFNFGTLVRYKIPLLPFYLAGIFIIRHLAKNQGK